MNQPLSEKFWLNGHFQLRNRRSVSSSAKAQKPTALWLAAATAKALPAVSLGNAGLVFRRKGPPVSNLLFIHKTAGYVK